MTNIKKEVKEVVSIIKDLNSMEFEDGSTIKVKGGIKNKGKIIKLELQYDKDFIEDDVHITVKAGCNEINLMSPGKSDGFTASFGATKTF